MVDNEDDDEERLAGEERDNEGLDRDDETETGVPLVLPRLGGASTTTNNRVRRSYQVIAFISFGIQHISVMITPLSRRLSFSLVIETSQLLTKPHIPRMQKVMVSA